MHIPTSNQIVLFFLPFDSVKDQKAEKNNTDNYNLIFKWECALENTTSIIIHTFGF